VHCHMGHPFHVSQHFRGLSYGSSVAGSRSSNLPFAITKRTSGCKVAVARAGPKGTRGGSGFAPTSPHVGNSEARQPDRFRGVASNLRETPGWATVLNTHRHRKGAGTKQ